MSQPSLDISSQVHVKDIQQIVEERLLAELPENYKASLTPVELQKK